MEQTNLAGHINPSTQKWTMSRPGSTAEMKGGVTHEVGPIGRSSYELEREESIGWPQDLASGLVPGARSPRADTWEPALQLGPWEPRLEHAHFSSMPNLFEGVPDFFDDEPEQEQAFDFEQLQLSVASSTASELSSSLPHGVKRERAQSPAGVIRDEKKCGEDWSLTGYCERHMQIRPHEIKPTVLLKMLDLTALFQRMCAERIIHLVNAEPGQVASIFGFSRMLVSNVAEFNKRISGLIRQDRRACWRAKGRPKVSNPTGACYELLRQLGIHPVKGRRIDLSGNSRDFLSHSEFAFSLERMQKNCARIKAGSIGGQRNPASGGL